MFFGKYIDTTSPFAARRKIEAQAAAEEATRRYREAQNPTPTTPQENAGIMSRILTALKR